MTNFGFYRMANEKIVEAREEAAAKAAMEKKESDFLERMCDILKITDRAIRPIVSVAQNDTVYRSYANGFMRDINELTDSKLVELGINEYRDKLRKLIVAFDSERLEYIQSFLGDSLEELGVELDEIKHEVINSLMLMGIHLEVTNMIELKHKLNSENFHKEVL